MDIYNYVSEDGLVFYEGLVKERLNKKVDKEFKTGSSSAYKVLSDNNLTDELLAKLNAALSETDIATLRSSVATNTSDITNLKSAGYQTASDVESILSGKDYVTSDELEDYATSEDITNALKGYATEAFVTGKGYITNAALAGYATEEFVTTQGYLTEDDLEGYATESFVTGKGYQTASQVEGIVTGKGYQTAEQVTSIVEGKGYITDAEVEAKGYLKSADLTGYAKESWVEDKGYQTAANVETILSGKNYATESFVTGKGYQTSTQVQGLIDAALEDITGIDFEVVTGELPSTGKKGTIYLKSNSGTAPNVYDEYIYVNNSWEKIGTTEVDLTNYVQKTQMVAVSNERITQIVNGLSD